MLTVKINSVTYEVHIELVPSLSTLHFIEAFVRFSNRHCLPRILISDNMSTLLQSAKILANSKIDNEFSEFLVENNIKHHTIPNFSPWVGSTWERLIRVIKSCLHKVMGRKRYEYFQLLTLMSDIENSINSRPLTHKNYDDELHVLTPNCFLKFDPGRALILESMAGEELRFPGRRELVDSFATREEFNEKFRSLWVEDYLLALREICTADFKDGWSNQVKLNDIVMINTPGKSRPFWSLGRVVELIPSSDNKTRFVKVKKSDRSESVYAIKHLYPLELNLSDDSALDKETKPGNVQSSPRPVRAAALKCLEKLRCN